MVMTPTLVARAMTPSESREAALHGHRALTPIISGAVSGGIVGVAWIVGIIYWLYKRRRRARRAKAAGVSYREYLDPPKLKDPFVIPPDPAVVKGQVLPGENLVKDKDKDKDKDKKGRGKEKDKDGGSSEDSLNSLNLKGKAKLVNARTMSATSAEEDVLDEHAGMDGQVADGSTVNLNGSGAKEDVSPGMKRRVSAPESIKKRDTYPPPTAADSKRS